VKIPPDLVLILSAASGWASATSTPGHNCQGLITKAASAFQGKT